ncbi:NTP/NDP exchange transporter [Candidatus Dependentiae bacterium]
MSSELKQACENLYAEKKFERLKFLFLSALFFFAIGAYTIIRDLKNAIFIEIVGKEYIPVAKLAILLVLIPAILFYSKVVDRIKRYHLLGFYSALFAIGCLIMAFFVGNPKIGISNTDQSVYRIFGWVFYFFGECFSPFVLGVFWAFSNSISKPDGAKRNYGLMVSSSKIGGMVTAGLTWALFSFTTIPFLGHITDVFKIQIILFIASAFLFAIPLVTIFLMRTVPGRYLHGYEAVYKVEKQRGKTGKAKTGIFAGLKMLIKYPYVLGIFGMIFFYEVLNSILGYLRLGVAKKASASMIGVSPIAGTTAFLFKWVFIMHLIGLAISLFGTSLLPRILGTRICVILIPVIMGIVVLCFVVSDTPFIVMTAFTLTKAINYAFSKPVVETLYIPTLKEIKFKSKSWIDAFGSKVAKGTGSVFNLIAGFARPALFLPLYSFFFAIIIGVWVMVSFLLGKRFDEAIKSNEAIGEPGTR